jgi:hypothetical protein
LLSATHASGPSSDYFGYNIKVASRRGSLDPSQYLSQ